MITHRQVEAFRQVMSAGTATAAARNMNISQPAVSRLVTTLEYELGFALFVRRNRLLFPTKEAQQFHDHVEQSFVGIERLRQAASDILEHSGKRLSLVCIPSLSTNIAVELVDRFHRHRPDLAVSLDVQPSQRIFEWISTGKCELGMTSLPVHAPTIDKQAICTGAAVCIVRRGHRLEKRDSVCAEDLAKETFVGYRADSEFRQFVDTLFERSAILRKVAFEARTTNAIIAMVAAGLGVSIVEPSFARLAGNRRVVSIPFLPEIPVTLTLMRLRERTLSQAAEYFLHLAARYFEQQELQAAGKEAAPLASSPHSPRPNSSALLPRPAVRLTGRKGGNEV